MAGESATYATRGTAELPYGSTTTVTVIGFEAFPEERIVGDDGTRWVQHAMCSVQETEIANPLEGDTLTIGGVAWAIVGRGGARPASGGLRTLQLVREIEAERAEAGYRK